jgi:hypothetical protein
MIRALVYVLGLCLATQTDGLADNSKPPKSPVAAETNKSPKSQLAPLRNQIKTLERQRKETVQSIKTRYAALIRGDRGSEAVIKKEAAFLKQQENALLALTTNDTQREGIQRKFGMMLKILNGETKVDDRLVAELQVEEQALIGQVNGLYQARINQLNAEIQSLQANAGSAGSKSPKPAVAGRPGK